MSENDSGAEKTLDPTEKRIRESRERGEVARSKELTTAERDLLRASVENVVQKGPHGPANFLDEIRSKIPSAPPPA